MLAQILEENENVRHDSHAEYLIGMSEGELVAAAQDGSSPAFELLVERHRQKIFSLALRVTGNREDAEDIVQLSLQKAYVHLNEFEGRSSFSTWLTRIAFNEAFMLLRSNRKVFDVSIDAMSETDEPSTMPELPDSSPNPEHRYSQRERGQLLTVAMNRLKPEMRSAIRLKELEELSMEETAQVLGISVTAAKSRVLRGRRRLREVMKKHLQSAGTWENKPFHITGRMNGVMRDPIECNASA